MGLRGGKGLRRILILLGLGAVVLIGLDLAATTEPGSHDASVMAATARTPPSWWCFSFFINKPVRDATLGVALKRAAEKLAIRRRLRDHTRELEARVEAATRALKRQAQFQARLIRSSTDGIVATDQTLKIVIFNPAAAGHRLGRGGGEGPGLPLGPQGPRGRDQCHSRGQGKGSQQPFRHEGADLPQNPA